MTPTRGLHSVSILIAQEDRAKHMGTPHMGCLCLSWRGSEDSWELEQLWNRGHR